MAALILPHRWQQQPQEAVGVNWANPIATGLVSLVNPGRGWRSAVVHGPALTLGADVSHATTPLGRSLAIGQTPSTAGVWNDTAGVITGTPATCLVIGSVYTTTGAIHYISSCASASDKTLRIYAENDGSAFRAQQIGATTNGAASGGTFSYGEKWHVAAVFASDSARYIYKNGVRLGSNTTNTGATVSPVKLAYGQYRGSVNFNPLYGDIVLGAWWNRALSDAEIQSLYEAPWQLFTPIRRRIYVDVGAGGGPATITGTGALSSDASTIAGTAERAVSGTGALTSDAATLAGTAERALTAIGALSSQTATIAGTGAVTTTGTVIGTGALAAQGAAIAGTAERILTAAGALASGDAAIAGTATKLGEITGTGALQCGPATMDGFDVLARAATGAGKSRHTRRRRYIIEDRLYDLTPEELAFALEQMGKEPEQAHHVKRLPDRVERKVQEAKRRNLDRVRPLSYVPVTNILPEIVPRLEPLDTDTLIAVYEAMQAQQRDYRLGMLRAEEEMLVIAMVAA